MKNQPRSSFVMFVKASDAVSCPLLSLVFADRSLLGADYDDANCISQIVKKHFSDLCKVYFSDCKKASLRSCKLYSSNYALLGLLGLW